MEIDIQCHGYIIKADIHEGSDDTKVLLVLHGYSSSKQSQYPHAKALSEQTGAHVVALELSGHGNSTITLGSTQPAQHLLEVVCAYDWIISKHPEATVSVSGASYGGFLATSLAQYRTVDALILRAPAIYPPKALYDPWSIRLEDTDAYTRKAMAYRTDTTLLEQHPLFNTEPTYNRALVMVHEHDEMVPRQTTDAYIKSLNADSFIAEGFKHNMKNGTTIAQTEAYHTRVADWLNQEA